MKLLQLQKRTMALAGSLMTVYLLFHMLSNLTYFCPTWFDAFYSAYNGVARWLVLAVIVASLLVHVVIAVRIRKVNASVRPIGYKKHDKLHIPAPLVTLSIVLLLLFIVLHLVQTLNFDASSVYQQTTALFQSPLMTLIYLGGLFILAMHLQHSLSNVLQTLGITSKTCKLSVTAAVAALIVGFAAVPVAAFWSGL